MTIFTSVGHRFVTNYNTVSYLVRLMAAGAIYFFVRPDQLVLRIPVVLEIELAPIAVGVAGRAVFDRGRRGELAAVGIGMARRALIVGDIEHPERAAVGRRLRLVTGDTWLGEMRPGQDEIGLLVVRHGKQRR